MTKWCAIVPNTSHFKSIILKFKLFIIPVVRSYIILLYVGAIPFGEEVTHPGKKSLATSIFRKDTSKYAKLMLEPYICDILN